MKYLKIFVFLLLVFIAVANFTSKETQDCSTIDYTNYYNFAQNNCTLTTTQTVFGNYFAENIPDKQMPLIRSLIPTIIICVLISSFLEKGITSPYIRYATINISAGVIFASLIGAITDGYTGGVVGAIVILFLGLIVLELIPGLAGAIAGLFAASLTAVFAGEYGLTAPITLEWIVFCLSMVLLEQLIVFGRIKYQQIKQVKIQT
ncbi:MAG: hypothetical protein H6779_00700 [Candidatus Nomurabacteria bacterium]|nr:hypothetical protein [Candidatus Nomurabacteria bacterium]USN87949.1 MAG: hypothetical protein H6779_00700 [Candidatus Nomurabacteria bacterium]